MDKPLPYAVNPGWVRSHAVRSAGGPTYRLLEYPDGQWGFEHQCDRGERGVIICAPMLQTKNGGHHVTVEPLTVSPSILCTDCNTHGFVREGRWSS